MARAYKSTISLTCFAIAAFGLSSRASAQVTPGTSQDTPNPQATSAVSGSAGAAATRDLGEIVVTAERKSESLSKVGETVAAVGSEQLRVLRVKSADDLSHVVPSFQSTVSASTGTPVYNLRGVGFATQNIGATAPVGTYVDEVAYAYPFMTLGALFDLERVEVLLGPQGTLYGRNTTGGLIDYVTAKPTRTPQGSLTVGGGNYNSWEAGGFVSGPLSDTLRGRLAFDSENRETGWQHSVTRNDTLGKYHRNSVRLSFDWTPTSRLDVSLSGNYWQRTGDTQAAQAVKFIVGGQTAAATASLEAHPTATSADWAPQTDQPQSAITGIIREPNHAHDDFAAVALRMAYKLNDNLSLVSLTSFNDLKAYQCVDFAGVQTEQTTQCTVARIDSAAEEGRLLGQFGHLNFTVGGYYANDRINEHARGYAGELGTILGLRAFALSLPSQYTAQQINTSYRLYGQVGHTRDTVKAVFFNTDYSVTSQFKVTLGGRYTVDSINFKGAGQEQNGNNVALINTVFPVLLGNPNLQPVVANGSFSLNAADTGFAYAVESQRQSNFAFRANLDWTPSDNVLVYALIARGYKSGLFPTLAASTVTQLTPVNQEQLTDYEGGIKLNMFSRSLQFNGAVYYYDYVNRQVYGQVADLIFGTLPRVVNIPKSEVYGFNGDVTWRLAATTTLRSGVSLLHSQIKQFVGYNELGVVQDQKGTPLPMAPSFQVFASAAHDVNFSNGWGAELEVDGSYQSKSNSFIGGLPDFEIKAYGLVNASVTFHDPDRKWLVMAYIQNIGSTYYWTSQQVSHDSLVRFAGMPQTEGVRITRNF